MEGPQSAEPKGLQSSSAATAPCDPHDPRTHTSAAVPASSPDTATTKAALAEPAGPAPAASSLQANTASGALNAQLPPFEARPETLPETLPVHPFRAHVRHPTAHGLSLQTDLHFDSPADSRRSDDSTPHGSYLRTAASTHSMAGSLSPASALSSPALNALSDLTPLPSPLVMSDSPWARAGAPMRPRSRGQSNASLRDDPAFAVFGNGTLSPSPSIKKKAYQRLRNASADTSASALLPTRKSSEAYRDNSQRRVSELVPDGSPDFRGRHVAMSSSMPEFIEKESPPPLQRETYLAAQRGLITARVDSCIPTPPASNASNRSVTESESEDVGCDDKVEYITVRHGSLKSKKRWRPVRKLGQGTFSKVYLATSERRPANDPLDERTLDPHQLVAIKVVEHGPAGGADESRVELSLKREVEMLRSVSHPSLVHLKAFDNGDQQALIVLSYCPGGDLFDVASTHGENLTPPLVQRIFAELVSAVGYLHDQLIVHRDIKLENVLLNVHPSTLPSITHPHAHPYPLITLTDLGLSRRIPPPPDSPLLTTRCGSDDYAAPEILLGQPYDGRSTDAWALGVLLYALMESRLPFDPPPNKRNVGSRSRALHRIARCDWQWVKFGNDDEEWDPEKGKDWEGARLIVEGLLKKVSRGRKSVKEVQTMVWVQQGITVEGGLRRNEDEEDQSIMEDVDGES